MGKNKNHTPITGTPDIRTSVNTALGELDDAIGSIGTIEAAVIGHEVASPTDGGATVATTWNVRPISGLEVDSGAIVTIDSNKFTPIAGTYIIMANQSMWRSGVSRIRLYNVTQSTTTWSGGQEDTASDRYLLVPLFYVFSANGTDEYRIDHYSHTADADGLGLDITATSSSVNEVYMQTILIRIGT